MTTHCAMARSGGHNWEYLSRPITLLMVFVICLQVSSEVLADEPDQCYSYGPDRHVYPQGSATSDHQLQYTKALSKHIIHSMIDQSIILSHYQLRAVSRPAPLFEGTAVVNGEFTQISLKDFIGKYVVFFFYPLDL